MQPGLGLFFNQLQVDADELQIEHISFILDERWEATAAELECRLEWGDALRAHLQSGSGHQAGAASRGD